MVTGSDADRVVGIVQSHCDHQIAYLAGYVLLACTVDPDGVLHFSTAQPIDQDPSTTAEILNKATEAALQDG